MAPSDRARVTLDYDEVLEYIGQFGRFQKKIFFWLSFISAAAGLAVVVFAFTGFETNYRCRIPSCEGSNSSYFNKEGFLPSIYENVSIRLEDRCRLPRPVSKDLFISCSNSSVVFSKDDEHIYCEAEDLIFDRSIVSQSLIQTFGFVCDRSSLRTYYNAIYMLGMLFGSYLFGWYSDNFGRLNALMLSVLTISLSGFFGAFCGGPWGAAGFGLLRFITGMGGIGCFMVSFVLVVEHVGFKLTALFGVAIEIPFALGQAVLGLEAFVFRDWRVLQIVSHLPLLALLGLYWVIPESVRWLIGNGRVEEAKEIIEQAARENKQLVPHHLYKRAEIEALEEASLMESAESESDMFQDGRKEKTCITDVFRNCTMALRTLNMCFQWFSVTMCYYGLAFASTGLSGDPFTNFFLSVMVDIPGYLFCIIVMDCWGRRPILSFCQIVSGISCILCGLLQGTSDPNLQVVQVVLSLVGKFGASAIWGIVYVYAAELFPTSIRNQAVGTCSLVARIGGIICLLLDLLKVYWLPAPVFIMGVVATIAGFLAVFFPETLGRKLPETMDDAISIGSNDDRSFFTCSCFNIRDHYGEDLKQVPDDEQSNSECNK